MFVASGTPVDQLPTDFLNKLDSTVGLPEGTHASIYKAQVAASEQEAAAAEIEAAKNLVGLLNDIPQGQSITIAGSTYTGLRTGDITTGTELSKNGDMYLWSYNKSTGKTETQLVGNFGAGWSDYTDNTGRTWKVNDASGQKQLVFDPNDPTGGFKTSGLYEIFPEGSNGGQCGKFVNELTGIGFGDTYESKINKTDSSIGKEGNAPRAGDVFVQPYSWTGHAGVVVSSTSVGDGTFQLEVMDSNFGLDEKVQYRTINSSQVTGFARPGLLPAYAFGTDKGKQGITDLYDEAVANVSLGLTAAQEKSLAKQAAKLQAGGDMEGLRELIKTAAFNGLQTSQRDAAIGREQSIDTLLSIKNDLAAFQALGGNTNLLAGKLEKFQENILKTTGDKRLADLANRIQLGIISYRRAVSGAAFTESEAKAYEQIFPNIENTPVLNNVKIDSLISAFGNQQKSVMSLTLGQTVYEEIFGQEAAMKAGTPSMGNVEDTVYSNLLRMSESGQIGLISEARSRDLARQAQQLSDEGRTQDEIAQLMNEELGL